MEMRKGKYQEKGAPLAEGKPGDRTSPEPCWGEEPGRICRVEDSS